jgi:thymidylate kinase
MPYMLKEPLPKQPAVTLTATLVDCLADTFNREGIVYCHWKSNIALAQATAGMIDLDLLVDRRFLPQALAILSKLGFKAAAAKWGANPTSIGHYYGLDPDTKQLIHVHLFSRVLTGESYVKSHVFPFEAMLLENVYYSGAIRVTSKPAELVLFTLRMFIKYGSLFDLVSLRRKSESITSELRWLRSGGNLSEALSLLKNYCPVIDEQLFVKCVETLDGDHSLFARMMLAQQVRRRLKVYAKYTFLKRLLAYAQMLWAEVQRRLRTKQQNKVLQAGGAVIAFVGADATGKSTLVTETGRWLGDTFAVAVIHTGKPPSSWLTAPLNLVLAFGRRAGSSQRINHLKSQKTFSDSSLALHSFRGVSSLLYALRVISLAWDRQQLILKSRRRAAEGEIIVCDRYPSRVIGAMDSPCLVEESLKTGPLVAIYNGLARLEKQLYAQIPPPDIVLRLRVSLDTALQRNRERDQQDRAGYLEARHRQSQEWQMPGIRCIYEIDTEQSLEDTICKVQEAIWESL